MDQRLSFDETPEQRTFDETTVQEILTVAAALQDREGERIPEDRLAKIADEAGVQPEYVRLAMEVIEQRQHREAATQKLVKQRKRFWVHLRERYERTTGLARHVVNGVLSGLLGGLALGIFGNLPHMDAVSALLIFVSVVLGIVSAARARNAGWGALAGGGWGAAFAVSASLFDAAGADDVIGGVMGGLFVGLILGAIGSASVHVEVETSSARHELPTSEDRQELLRQLYALQDKLRRGTTNATFLSVDVVNSTGMKAGVDPLAVEYTFGAYHRYVSDTVVSFGGQVHNTAGDGVTCVFEAAEKAFQAARMLVRNLGKLNAEHNRLAGAFVLRCGIHTGAVVAPSGDLRGVEFAHVIDVAAHLQKAAPPGGIVLSEASFGDVRDPVLRLGLTPLDVEGQSALLFRTSS